MLLLCRTGRSFALLVIVFLLVQKAELLALSDCVELFTKPWSSAVNDVYFQFFIVRGLIDLICHLPRIGYEEAGNQSFERRGCLSLFLSPSLTLSLFISPGFVWGRLKVKEWWRRKKKRGRMTSHHCAQSFSLCFGGFFFSSARWKHNARTLILPPGCLSGDSSSHVWTDILIFPHHTTILITLDQIVCSGIGSRHCPWLCFVSILFAGYSRVFF